MIKNIIFDFGGVIADLEYDRAVKGFTELGVKNADSFLGKYHQTGFFQDLEEGKIGESEFTEKLSELCGRKLNREEIEKACTSYFPAVNTQKLDILEVLRENYHLYVLSNTNPYVISWACSERFSVLKKPLNEYFDKMFLSYQIGSTKPNEKIFRAAIKEGKLNPDETLFIDDGPSNIEAAKKIGLKTLLVDSTEDWRRRLIEFLNSNN